MTLHDALFPWATPFRVLLFLSALVACLIFGDATYGDVALAVDPVTLGLMVAGGMAAKGLGGAYQSWQAKKGVEAIKGSEGYKTTQELGEKAGERLTRGEYGASAAGKRQQLGDIIRAQEGATRGDKEQTKRAVVAQGGYGRSGRALGALRDVVTRGAADTVAKGTQAVEAADTQRAAAERAADMAALQTATGQRGQLEQALASARGGIVGNLLGGAGEGVAGYGKSQIAAQAYERSGGEPSLAEQLDDEDLGWGEDLPGPKR